jgi:hypothetical protein
MTRERPLSRTQIKMLRRVRDGDDYNSGAYGMSERAGAETTKWSLLRRGLLTWLRDDLVITAAGRAALREIDREH